jgi:hypothetical protein
MSNRLKMAAVAKATAVPAHRAEAIPVAVSAVGLLKRWIGRTGRIRKRTIQLNPISISYEISHLEMRELWVSMLQYSQSSKKED